METEQDKNTWISRHKKLAALLGIAAVGGGAASVAALTPHEAVATVDQTAAHSEAPQSPLTAAPSELPQTVVSPSTIETNGTVSVPVATPEVTPLPVPAATPEATPGNAARYIVEPTGEGSSIEGTADSYYYGSYTKDFTQAEVVAAIKAANPGKNPAEYYAWGSVNIPTEIDGVKATVHTNKVVGGSAAN